MTSCQGPPHRLVVRVLTGRAPDGAWDHDRPGCWRSLLGRVAEAAVSRTVAAWSVPTVWVEGRGRSSNRIKGGLGVDREVLPDLETGTADMSWVTTINLDPLTEFADVLGHETSSIGGVGGGYNFPVLGTYKGDKGL